MDDNIKNKLIELQDALMKANLNFFLVAFKPIGGNGETSYMEGHALTLGTLDIIAECLAEIEEDLIAVEESLTDINVPDGYEKDKTTPVDISYILNNLN